MPKTIFSGANQTVVAVIKAVRLEVGLTQAELAKRLGRDQSHISLIEGAQRRLDVVEFYGIALALGQDPVQLFSRITAQLNAQAEAN